MTGRVMSRLLQEALDNLTGVDRRYAIAAFAELAPQSPTLGALYTALAAELTICGIREEQTLLEMETALRPPFELEPTEERDDNAPWWPNGDAA